MTMRTVMTSMLIILTHTQWKCIGDNKFAIKT